MNKMTMSGKWAIIVVVVVVVLTLAWAFGGGRTGNQQPAAGTPSSTATNDATGGTPGSPTQSSNGGTIPSTPAKGTPIPSISLITPVANETWKIAAQNPISWSKEAGFSGQIDLLDATTHALVGVILNQTGPHQTSYSWNTRDMLPSRTNALKIAVVPGTYVVKVVFDGNNVPTLMSGPFTIIK